MTDSLHQSCLPVQTEILASFLTVVKEDKINVRLLETKTNPCITGTVKGEITTNLQYVQSFMFDILCRLFPNVPQQSTSRFISGCIAFCSLTHKRKPLRDAVKDFLSLLNKAGNQSDSD